MNQISRVLILVILSSMFTGAVHGKNQTIQVVTSFSILEDLVQELGGPQVEITNLVGRNRDAHVYRPTPSDAVAVANAELLVINGLGFEGWISRLIGNSQSNAELIVASNGVMSLLLNDEVDPHAWQSLDNIKIYINNITTALIEHIPDAENELILRKKSLLDKIERLQKEFTDKLKGIQESDRLVVTSHDAFGYLGNELSIRFIAPMGFNTDTEPTARDVADLIDQIKSQNVRAMFLENISDPRLLKQISSETKVAIGGRLYSDALSEIEQPASTYLNMMRHNLTLIYSALVTPRGIEK